MLGKLSEKQIDDLVTRQVTGRIGCVENNKAYIVPINYFYKNSTIYAHSAAGKKIDTMRKNPHVCFQVDQIDSIFRWQSAILWGTYEEITDPEKKHQAMQGIIHWLMPLVESPTGHPSHAIAAVQADLDRIDLIVYKINITEKTGRFESCEGQQDEISG
jgi:nitroimidazol reductase NimA-like FMN-containing flavoprotein (pyridoxamine 5'-phosphate oxidase superfamily)